MTKDQINELTAQIIAQATAILAGNGLALNGPTYHLGSYKVENQSWKSPIDCAVDYMLRAASPLFDEPEADAAFETLLNFADERGFRCLVEDNFAA